MWAVMDIGTNSCRLLLAEKNGIPGRIKKVRSYLSITRLGEGMNDKNRTIKAQAIERTMAVLREFALIIAKQPVKKIILVATQAVREAENRDALVCQIKKELSWELSILSADREARLSYEGAVAGFESQGPKLVVDIGGGSTELAWKEKNGEFMAFSVPIGALRLLEAPQSMAGISGTMRQALAEKRQAGLLGEAADYLLVGVGGTCTTAAAINLHLDEYDPARVQGHCLMQATIREQYDLLKGLSPCRRLSVAGLSSGREELIVPGLKILLAVLQVLRQNAITISDWGLLDGLIFAAE